jgi:hypothetical protein
MTFEDLEQQLPNGFHDALIKRIVFDFQHRAIRFDMDVWVGELRGPDQEQRRRATVNLASPYFCGIEPPAPDYKFMPERGSVSIDGDPIKQGQNQQVDQVLCRLPTGAKAYRFFVYDWNSFIYVAAQEVELAWADDLDELPK